MSYYNDEDNTFMPDPYEEWVGILLIAIAVGLIFILI